VSSLATAVLQREKISTSQQQMRPVNGQQATEPHRMFHKRNETYPVPRAWWVSRT
jgi:hypothetical protein